jgi:hypothetical protein
MKSGVAGETFGDLLTAGQPAAAKEPKQCHWDACKWDAANAVFRQDRSWGEGAFVHKPLPRRQIGA